MSTRCFQFRYQTLLDRRREDEQQRQREVARCLRTRMILLDQLRGMQQTISTAKHEATAGLVGRVDVEAIRQIAAYSGQSTARGHAIVRKLASVEQEVTAARASLLDATRKRKALELLRDRERRAWQRGLDAREAAELDDLAAQRWLRERRRQAALEPAAVADGGEA